MRRAGAGRPQLEALATAGALEGLAAATTAPPEHGAGPGARRCGRPGALAQATADRLPGLVSGEEAPPLPDLAPLEEVEADMWATGLTVGPSAVELARPRLDALGVIPAGRLVGSRDRRQGARGRGGHPPPAPRERQGDRVPQPRGRDGHGQRHLLPRCLGALAPTRPAVTRPAWSGAGSSGSTAW